MESTRENETHEVVTQPEATARGAYVPHVDIYENDVEVVVVADVPGVDPDGLSVDFHQGVLTLHGRVQGRHPDAARMMLREYGTGDFQRSFRVDESIDVERVRAEYRHGSLTLTLPKAEAAVPRRIDVRVR